MVIVDTTVWIDYFRGGDTRQAAWLDRELARQRMGLTDIILCEVLQGLPDDTVARRIERELRKFAIYRGIDDTIAVAAACNYRFLRRRGHTVRKTIDCLIATFCIKNGHRLLHADRDFDVFERLLGLAVVPC